MRKESSIMNTNAPLIIELFLMENMSLGSNEDIMNIRLQICEFKP